MEITTIIGIVLLVLGIILVGLEMHIPGFGICGIGGIISLGLGIVLTANTIEQGIMLAIGIVVIIAVMFTIFIISYLFFDWNINLSTLTFLYLACSIKYLFLPTTIIFCIKINAITNKTIPIKELVKRFIEIDKEYNGESWNIKQILANIDIIIPIEDRWNFHSIGYFNI